MTSPDIYISTATDSSTHISCDVQILLDGIVRLLCYSKLLCICHVYSYKSTPKCQGRNQAWAWEASVPYLESKFVSSHWLGISLIQQLVATAQAVIGDWSLPSPCLVKPQIRAQPILPYRLNQIRLMPHSPLSFLFIRFLNFLIHHMAFLAYSRMHSFMLRMSQNKCWQGLWYRPYRESLKQFHRPLSYIQTHGPCGKGMYGEGKGSQEGICP